MVMTHTPPGGNGRPNYFRNGDIPLNLGRYIALLSSEYELLGRSGQFTAQKKTLNELFLALQAYRRLDMTANRLWRIRLDACGSPCNWQPDLSGASGWFIRDDIPGDFHELFPADQPAHWQVGATQSDYTGGFDGFPCNDFPSPLSQDQVIGMLHGLAFVKKFIPPETRVSINGATYAILEMAGDIAYGMVSRIRQADGHKIRYPACSGKKVERGPDANWLLHGMIQAANFILPSGRHISGSLGISLEWAAARRGILLTNGWDNLDNVRMLAELVSAANINYTEAVQAAAHDVFWMQHFGWALLHDRSLADDDFRLMACLLCDYGCPGPCYQTPYYTQADVGPAFICANSNPPPGIVSGRGCRAWFRDFWKRGFECNQGFHGVKQPGVSFMLAYNLLHLAGGTAYGHYYDPSHIESSGMLPNAELDIAGPASIFPGQEALYEVMFGGWANYIWSHSAKLEITWTEPDYSIAATFRALPGTSGEAFIEAADELAAEAGECQRPARVRKAIWINQPPPPNPVINGNLPGMVATERSDFCDRCVVDPEKQIDAYLVPRPNYVMGYRSGKNDCSAWAPYDGYCLNHRQGIQRLNRGDKNYLIVSNSTHSPVWVGFEVVEIGSTSGTAHELYQTLAQPGQCPPCSDRIIRYESRKFFRHADGLQVFGNRFLVVGYSDPVAQQTNEKPQWCIYDLQNPANPVRRSCTTVLSGWASAAAMTRLSNGKYMVWAFGKDTAKVELFTADAPDAAQWQSHGVKDPFGSDWENYQGVQFITGCNGTLYLVCTHNNKAAGNGEDWVDLWRVTFENNSLSKPQVVKKQNRHMYCSNSYTNNTRYCNFQAGADSYVTSEGYLLLYGVEHYTDLCGGQGVKWREFPNNANGH